MPSVLRHEDDAPALPVRPSVLVVDDEESFHRDVARFLKNYRVLKAYNGWDAIDVLSQHHVDVVLLDLNLPDKNGLQLLDTIRGEHEDVEVIIITAHTSLRSAVSAVKKGAFDFIAKDFESYQKLDEHITRALIHRRRKRERIEAQSRHAWIHDAFDLLRRTPSKRVKEVLAVADKVAKTPLTVLLEGESGVGKEIFARYVHRFSDRAEEPFVTVNVATMPTTLVESHLFGHVKGAFTGADRTNVGKFELADGGTVFLDEVGELEPQTQVKLLRVLQEREVERLGAREPSPVNVRVIAATNKRLKEEVAAGRFREDLYYRLNVVRLPIPPLRERIEELPGLVSLLTTKHAAIMNRDAPKYSDDVLAILTKYSWPGNVRELENLIMRLVALHAGETIQPDDIPTEYCLPALYNLAKQAAEEGKPGSKEQRVYFLARDQFERYLVRLTVNRFNGDKRAAARALGVSYSTVKEKWRET